MNKKTVFVLCLLSLVLSASAEIPLDRSVMSEKYWAIWNDDVQKRIDADIEKYRKADASFAVDAPEGTTVSVEQMTHAFYFGAHIFNFDQLGTHARNVAYKKLWGAEGALFNSGTVAFYWRTFEPYQGATRFRTAYEDTETFWNDCKNPKLQPHWRRPATDAPIAFLKSRGCRVHGHPLAWGNLSWMTPAWLWSEFCPQSEKDALFAATGVKIAENDLLEGRPGVKGSWKGSWTKAWKKVFEKLTAEQIAEILPTFTARYNALYQKRVREICEHYGTRVDSWDVVNESSSQYSAAVGVETGRALECNSHYGLMPGDFTLSAFRWAQAALPKKGEGRGLLNLNDYANGTNYIAQVKDLLAHGAEVEVLGCQMHLFNPKDATAIAEGTANISPGKAAGSPADTYARFLPLCDLNLPIHLSEITITAAGENSPRDQMIQANIARNLYRIWFSIPKMFAITWWNVVDDCGAPGEPSYSGIFTRDMKPKPAYYELDRLINREWRTKCEVKVEGQGQQRTVSFRGFRGKYRLTWKDADGKEQTKLVELK